MAPKERNRTLFIALLALAAGAFSLVGYLRAGSRQAEAPARYYYRNSSGAVLFQHEGHQDFLDCGDCHHELDQASEEPHVCGSCHPAEPGEGDRFLGCQECHDDPEYTPDMVEHLDLIELEDHDCEGCHSARTLTEAFHAQCGNCHLELAPERFADAEGNSRCEACHLK